MVLLRVFYLCVAFDGASGLRVILFASLLCGFCIVVIVCLVVFAGWLIGVVVCLWFGLVILVLIALWLCGLFSLGCCDLPVWCMLVFVVLWFAVWCELVG